MEFLIKTESGHEADDITHGKCAQPESGIILFGIAETIPRTWCGVAALHFLNNFNNLGTSDCSFPTERIPLC